MTLSEKYTQIILYFTIRILIIPEEFYYSKTKQYRMDLNLWEEEFIIFWFIHYYEYSIWKEGKICGEFRLFKKNWRRIRYFSFFELPTIKIGKKEFEEKFKSNKWTIPMNYELDLDLP